MRYTRVHVNAIIGLLIYCLLTAALMLLVWGLVSDFISTNGHDDIKYLLMGVLLPMIAGALREIASVVKRFTYMGGTDGQDD